MPLSSSNTLVLYNGNLHTLNASKPFASAIAMTDGRITRVGNDAEIMNANPGAPAIDLQGKTVIPGLYDDHIHLIRGGLNYNLELRWDGVPTLSDAMHMLKLQAAKTPPPQWVRVVGGWSEYQFLEKRMPTLEEINEVAPETPVFILHLYDSAMLNAAALRAIGYDKNTPDNLPGGVIERDRNGNPTGLLLAKPNAFILYNALNKGPKLGYADQMNSTRQFMRELNRLGVTSVSDAGGGFQNFPEDYAVINDLATQGLMTVRIAYNLFTQHAGKEIDDFRDWTTTHRVNEGNEWLRLDGAGEMLVFSASDFEDFLQDRPDLGPTLETELHDVVKLLAEKRWPFRLHATYDESIRRFLSVFENVNREVPFAGLRWHFDHAETISDESIERVRALGGGIALQNRMAFQGEYFQNRYGKEKARQTPPIRKILEMDIPVGCGTDATRVSSYNPWIALYWLVTGKTVGGTAIYGDENILTRTEALRLYTGGSAGLAAEEDRKGMLKEGYYGDLTVLSGDYFRVSDEEVKSLSSVLTVVGGKVVYAADLFQRFDPPPLPVSPDWSPVANFGGYYQSGARMQFTAAKPAPPVRQKSCRHRGSFPFHMHWFKGAQGLWGFGCDCFAI